MEKIDRKLQSGNSALISQVFSQLVLSAQTKNSAKLEFAYLKSKCLSDSSGLINDIARLTIVELLQRNLLQIDDVLADCVTSVASTNNTVSLVKLIGSILQLQTAASSAPRQFQLSQHPLIKILQEDQRADVQMSIFNEIAHSCHSNPRAHQLHEPLYLYCLCSPLSKIELGLLRHKLWTFFIGYDEDNQTIWVLKLACWLQMENKHTELAGSLLDEALQRQLLNPGKYVDYLIFAQILVVEKMVARNADCRLVIKTLLDLLKRVAIGHSNAALLILSKAVLVCSPGYLEELLQLCLVLANHSQCKPQCYLALRSVLLHWLATPNLLTEKAMNVAQTILKLQIGRPKEPSASASPIPHHYMWMTNPDMFLNVHLANISNIPALVAGFQDAPLHFHKTNFTFLCGLLLNQQLRTEHQLNVLSMIVACSSGHQELLPTVLSLLLCKLASADDPRLHFAILKALPAMARLKDNTPKVIATIRAISQQAPDLKDFALRLLYDTWEVDNSAYWALEEAAMQRSAAPKGLEMERQISRAFIFRQLTERRPELYGKDLVASLSQILNECTGLEGAVPTALALEGIQGLCKAEIIDIVTTWKTLSPKFRLDTRVAVIKSLCALIGEIPNLEYAHSFDKLLDEVVAHLWSYVAESEHVEVQNAAFQALSAFSLETISRHIPSAYLADHNDKEAVIVTVCFYWLVGFSGKIWVSFLSEHPCKEAARDFLTKLVAAEVDNYLKFVYQLKAQREPVNYLALPAHSIVRALTEFIKHHFLKVKNWKDPAKDQLFMNCLKVLSTKYSKPLPPLDWSFLLELVHDPALKSHCLSLAAHQAVLSGSARRLVETYIIGITEAPQFESAIQVYRNLIHIANSIQPVVLKPFFQNSLHSLLESAQLELVLTHVSEVLQAKDVQEVNKHTIEEVITELIFVADAHSQSFLSLLGCVEAFSPQALTKIVTATPQKVGQKEFEKILKITCSISKKTASSAPLAWLNHMFALAYHNKIDLLVYVDELKSVLKQRATHEDSPAWLNDRFGEIQVKVADGCDIKETEQLCDILAIAVVFLSGLHVILPSGHINSIKYAFPAALSFLLDQLAWGLYTTQILEWMHYMSSSESISEEYRNIFGWTLAGLRHQEEFSRGSRWTKYLDCRLCTVDAV
ncbi:focadhesin isoform X1 [Dendroctonus ponderosae]|uniref:focadhesin isoform X1 n=1 Tax=Dendroctonus ponderosae TaxID=77166 RepID=UPI0020365169|nr:focadhesin isoform X1 [Dendroctonus ponderosae]